MKSLKEQKEKMAKKLGSRRSEEKPVTKKDHKLSIKHLKDSIDFNKNHYKEHEEVLGKDGYSNKYNEKHAEEHEKHMKEDKKLIKERIKEMKKC